MNKIVLNDHNLASVCNQLLGTDKLAKRFPEAMLWDMIVTDQHYKKADVLFVSVSNNMLTVHLLDKHTFVQGRKVSGLKEVCITLSNGNTLSFIRDGEQWYEA